MHGASAPEASSQIHISSSWLLMGLPDTIAESQKMKAVAHQLALQQKCASWGDNAEPS